MKNLKMGRMSWNCCHLSGKHDIWAKNGSREKIDGGGMRVKLEAEAKAEIHVRFHIKFSYPLSALMD